MKFEFEDNITKDSWIEEYHSFEEITEEMLEGMTVISVFECGACKKEIKTKDHERAIEGICKKCKKSGKEVEKNVQE